MMLIAPDLLARVILYIVAFVLLLVLFFHDGPPPA